MRSTLILASGLVSFMHGKNDGQKGVGIATLILVTLIPGSFAINPNLDITTLSQNVESVSIQVTQIDANKLPTKEALLASDIKIATTKLQSLVADAKNGNIDRIGIRKNILKIKDSYTSLNSLKTVSLIPSANASNGVSLVELGKNNMQAVLYAYEKIEINLGKR